MPAAPAVTYRAAGVALGRVTAWGRDGYDWEAQLMVEHFEPGTVPLVNRHGGPLIAYLETLRAEGADLHFTTGPLTDDAIIEKLRHGHTISTEMTWDMAMWPWGGLPSGVLGPMGPDTMAIQFRHFTGTLQPGPNLVGVALVRRGFSNDSMAWLVTA